MIFTLLLVQRSSLIFKCLMFGNSAASVSSVSFSPLSFFACCDKCLCGSVELGSSCKILSSRTTAAAFKRSSVPACKSPSQSGLWAVDIPLCMERWEDYGTLVCLFSHFFQPVVWNPACVALVSASQGWVEYIGWGRQGTGAPSTQTQGS